MAGYIATATATTGSVAYETKLTSRNHAFVADEPEDIGGRDTGPRPGEILCMSLASCTAITLAMYAGRKGWDTGTITVTVSRVIHETGTDFTTEIQFENPLDEASRERLLVIAKKCPVHKVLTNPIQIETHMI